ncbi:MAG: alpha-amylase family glycosyl hydrolase [Deltaproteobacteria bacterium]
MMGADFNQATKRCEFRVWAPHANEVSVVSPFSAWAAAPVPLSGIGSGYWATTISGVSAGDAYKFIIQNGAQHWRVDAHSRDVDTDNEGNWNSIIVNRDWNWKPFSTPRFDDLILYQLHVGSFAGFNDGIPTQTKNGKQVATCASITAKLDYIKGLGFNAIALLPIGEFPDPADQAHMGYAPTDWFAPESDVGYPQDVRRLVDAAHEKGLAVIFDVVYNHAATDGNQYWQYDGDSNDKGGIYFEGGGDTNFGPPVPRPDARRSRGLVRSRPVPHGLGPQRHRSRHPHAVHGLRGAPPRLLVAHARREPAP